MKNEAFEIFTKDMNHAVKRVMRQPGILDSLGQAQFNQFYALLKRYNPKKSDAQDAKYEVMQLCQGVEERLEKAKSEVRGGISLETGKRIAENSCVLELHVRQPGFTRKIDSDTFLDKSGNKGKVDADILHVHQDLIDKKFVKELMDQRAVLLEFVRAWAVPGGMLTLGGGQFLVPLKAIEQITERIHQFGAEREALLDKFGQQWDDIVTDAKVKRGVFFNPNDYPAFKDVRAKFTHDYKFISNTVPEELEKISHDLFVAEHERRMLECAGTARDIQTALRTSMYELSARFADRLGVDEETGKPKRFNKQRLDDINEFLDTFSTKNLTGDAGLEKIVNDARALLADTDVDKIRSDKEFRGSLKKAFEAIAEATDRMVETSGRRVKVV